MLAWCTQIQTHTHTHTRTHAHMYMYAHTHTRIHTQARARAQYTFGGRFRFCLPLHTQCLVNLPIPEGYVIPILKNLHGRPKGPQLWDNHIQGIVCKNLGFAATTHKQCFYFKQTLTDGLILIVRQVDDFIIAAKTMTTCQNIRKEIQSYMANPINNLGIIKRFNGVNIVQTRHYVKVHCETYIA